MQWLLESIDWPCLVGFLGLLAVLGWVHWIDGGPWGPEVLPEPDRRCVPDSDHAMWIGRR